MKLFKKIRLIAVTIVVTLLFVQCATLSVSTISLAGSWQVQLDSLNQGETQNWAGSKFVGTPITLPGTLDDASIGTPSTLEPALNNYVLSNLTRKRQYIGKAWYQKEIEIPSSWKEKTIHLTLERVLWESKVFIDGKALGSAKSLSTSHEYDLTKNLTPGKHLVTIVIDNGNKFPLINVPGTKYPDPINQDMAHAYTNHTQVKWNGVIGKMLLTSSESNAPTKLQIYPDVTSNKLEISFEQQRTRPIENIHFEIVDASGKLLYSEKEQPVTQKENKWYFDMNKPEGIATWDEFDPNVYEARLMTNTDTLRSNFGFRTLADQDGVLTLNGKRIFLRGNLECAIFPLTGHPPMQKTEWVTLITQAKAYGINHLRFHSWCPPKAAFEAADEAGFYLQVELPHWSLRFGEDAKTTAFLREEAAQILADYGNHPSFLFMALGNELQGDVALMNTMVQELKAKDDRHLYATTAFSFQKPMGTRPEAEDEFFVTQWTEKGWLRGQGIFNDKAPHFDKDYTENGDFIKVPLISHEIGQYSVYPDLTEIPKYSGVLEPLNFIAIKNDLESKGLLSQAADFTLASGKLAAMLYKEEIERALKTPSFDGFQLLQLQDFPGQGTALVGLLNAFWESKGAISAKEFRKFNSEVVPLIRFEKAIYEDGEIFEAAIEVANFYKPMQGQTVSWVIKNDAGDELGNGKKNLNQLPLGNVKVGALSFPIKTTTAKRLTIAVALEGTDYQNDWHIWVYPPQAPLAPKDVLVTTSFEKAIAALAKGQKVLLNPDLEVIKGVTGRFVPVFWSPVHFPDQPGTMGLLLDPKHKAFEHFPTQSHTEWQWWDLCIQSKSVITDGLAIAPVVQVIDNFVTNHRLTMAFETKVGKGKLLFSATDLFTDLDKRPVARQLKYSLLEYMKSDAFNPSDTLEVSQLKAIKNGAK